MPVIDYPADAGLVIRPVAYLDANGNLTVRDQITGQPILAAGAAVSGWHFFGDAGDPNKNKLGLILEDVPVVREE